MALVGKMASRTIAVFGLAAFLLVLAPKPFASPANHPAGVFKPAVDRIIKQTPIPILLPSKLPAVVRERDIKLAWGTTSENAYSIELFYEETGSNAAFAAGFSGSKQMIRDLPNARPVRLANGITAIFRPVSCGGSCAPANLWWEQNGVMYQIQIKLASTAGEKEQERALLEAANSSVLVKK